VKSRYRSKHPILAKDKRKLAITPVSSNQQIRLTASRRYTQFRMNSRTSRSGMANVLLGIVLHTAIALFGGFTLGFALDLVVGFLARGASSDIRTLAEFLPFVVSGALLGMFATRRWCSRSAPWVGLLGLTALVVGGQELWFGWSPTWSHQTVFFLSSIRGSNGILHNRFDHTSLPSETTGVISLYRLLKALRVGWPGSNVRFRDPQSETSSVSKHNTRGSSDHLKLRISFAYNPSRPLSRNWQNSGPEN
jgi:hypothetical protein